MYIIKPLAWITAIPRLDLSCHIVAGVFSPVLAKHSKSFNPIDTMAVSADRIQRDLKQSSAWSNSRPL